MSPLARGRCVGSLAALLGLGVPNTSLAVDPDPVLSQYVRDRFGADRGFPGGTVQAISQTDDGHLWVGTDRGLFRFDGLTFRAFPPPRTAGPPIPRVLGLAADARGTLWIRLGGPRLLRLEQGRLETVPGLEPSEDALTAMTLGREGSVLVAGILNGLLRWSGTRFEPLAAPRERYPASPVLSIGEAADGTLWMGTQEDGVLRLADGRLTRFTSELPDRQVGFVLPVGPRDIWIATGQGVVRWDGAGISSRGLDRRVRGAVATAMMVDRQSNVWIGTARGLMRVDADGVSALEPAEPAQAAVTALFEDRDGSVWIGGAGGLERLREVPFMAFGAAQGLPSDLNGPVVVDAERRVCFAPLGGGVFCMANGRVAEVRSEGLPGDVAYSLAGRGADVWVGRKSGALTRISRDGTNVRTYRPADRRGASPIYAVHAGADGTVWAGTLGGGLRRLHNGGFTTYTTKDGLPSDTITSLADRADGSVWVGTPAGLGAPSGGRWRAYTTQDGLPGGEVNCLIEDSARTLWIGTRDGLALFDNGRVQVPPGPPALRAEILGLAEDRLGWLWVATAQGVVRARREALRSTALAEGDVATYGAAEGLSGTALAKRHRSVVADVAGRIWFSTDRGLVVADPAQAADAVIPLVSRIESLSADGTSIEMSEPTRVPPGPNRVTIAFSAVSLSAPESIRYRYRLDGVDRGWSEPATIREASYTNLGPGPTASA